MRRQGKLPGRPQVPHPRPVGGVERAHLRLPGLGELAPTGGQPEGQGWSARIRGRPGPRHAPDREQAPDNRIGIVAPMERAYFDHNATTPLDDKVFEAMLPYLRERFGNASSRHELGTVARRAVDTARQQVGALVNAQPSQVIFVSGGTEANNLFVKGAAGYLKPTQVAVSAIEHPCIAKPAQELARQGWKVRKLAAKRDGQIELADVDAALKEPTGIVSVMLVNNETGVVLDVPAVAERARAARAWMHTDAVQALGKISV